MKMYTLAAAVLALAATSAFAATADGTFDRTLNVAGTTSLTVSTGTGYIHVYPGADGQVHVIGHVHASDGWFDRDADARVKRVVASPPIVQSGTILTIGNAHAESDLYHNISIDYDVTAPSGSTLKVTSGSGSLEVGGIQGAVTAGTGSGSIHVDNIGANARLETGSGSIHATNVHGAASLETGSGAVELAVFGAGDVKAQTGSGSIRVTGVSGGLRAEAGSGSIAAEGNPTSEWRLTSGSGGIHVKVDSTARFNLNAETGSGTVQIDRPIVMQGSLNKHHVTGSVNGGGPTLRATTGSGSITIR